MNFINGRWIPSQGENFSSLNPANGEVIWEGANATLDEISQATLAAHHALKDWARLKVSERAHFLVNFAEIVKSNQQKIAKLISEETGKPLWEAMTEVNSVISKIAISIRAHHERTELKEVEAGGFIRYKPHGVVAILGPFNFPAHLSNGHMVPALLAGNTVVYKPSEQTPAVAEFILQCWEKTGLPKGVINCIQGNANCAKILLQQDLQAIFFTGSYATGLQIHRSFSDKPEVLLALEMGGNNPLIMGNIKHLEAALYHTLQSTLITSGQRCTCARRVMIPDNAKGDTFINLLIKAYQTISIGEYHQTPEPFMGPVISEQQAISLLKSQKRLQQMGGQSLLLMSHQKANTGFVSPGIMDMTLVPNPPDEEIFGPFIQIYRYHRFEDALALANQTRFGLAAGLLSDDIEHYQQFYQTIRAGLINWNKPTTGAQSNLPFGGVGQSGNHRPSAFFAADYCAYPIASLESPTCVLPENLIPALSPVKTA